MARPTRSVNQSNSAVLTEPFDHLIQHIKQYDVRLYEALKRASKQIVDISNVVNETVAKFDDSKATFGMNKDLVEDGLALTNYYIVRRGGKFIDCVGKIQIEFGEVPTGADAVLDILRSTDDGVNWKTIFDHNQGFFAGLLVFPAGQTPMVKQTKFILPGVKKDDLLKIICIQQGTIQAGKGIEVVLQWELDGT